MRMSRRLGQYGGKRAAVVSVYGAPNEDITLTHTNGTTFSATTDATGYGGELEIRVGSYTVYGDVSKYTKSAVVDKYTKTVEAWPDGATIYYWYGLMPVGEWASAEALPTTSPYTSNPVGVQLPTDQTSGTSIYISSYSNASRGGTAYLPKTTIYGTALKLIYSNAFAYASGNGYLALNITEKVSGTYQAAAVIDIDTSATEATLDVSAFSGGSYYPAISMNTSSSGTSSRKSYITVHALYSVGETSNGTREEVSTTVALGDTRRSCSGISNGAWLAPTGGENYVGQGTDDYNSMMIPVPAFRFSGKSVLLKIAMKVYMSTEYNRVFRWAITTSTANASLYKGYGAVTDSYQLAQGTFSPALNGGASAWQTFLLPCDDIPSGTPFYIYLWRDNTNYGNIHVSSAVNVTLQYLVE